MRRESGDPGRQQAQNKLNENAARDLDREQVRVDHGWSVAAELLARMHSWTNGPDQDHNPDPRSNRTLEMKAY
eukprot:7666746-Alexandrium_andersonii.AAC.1